MYFLDSTEDKKHEYNQNDFARFHNQIIGTGVSDVDSLTVSAKNNMEIALSTGWIFANGYALEIENTKTLEHDVAHPDNDRIDRVVVRFDTNPEGLDFYPVIKKGTPAKEPVAPSLTRDNYIYEMSVAQVLIKAGKSYVEDSEITDERSNDDVCGYIPLHNIYRGMDVDEFGRLNFPKQTHVSAYSDTEQKIKERTPGGGGEDEKINFPKVSADTQNEYDSSDSSFKSKSSGVILVNAQLDMSYESDEYRITLLVYKNGKRFQEIGYVAGRSTNFRAVGINGTSLIPVDKNDVLDIRLYTRHDATVRGRGWEYCRVDYFKIS